MNEEDLRTFATGLTKQYRDRASAYARAHAQRLQASGDDEGYDVWLRVAELAQEPQTGNA